MRSDPADIKPASKSSSRPWKKPHVTPLINAKASLPLIPTLIGKKEDVVKLDRDKCTRCQACIKIMCPALLAGPDGYPQIDPNICNACHLCTRVCNFGALKGGNEA
jgi:indolepyruvate ferredoxin oxidoreductase alpha subunit